MLLALLNMIMKISVFKDVTLYSPVTVSEDHIAVIIRVEEKFDRKQSVKVVISWGFLPLSSCQAITHPVV